MHETRSDVRNRRPISRTASWALMLALGVAVPGLKTAAAASDLHAFWDNRCADCHRHAGEFARNHLKLKDGRLIGRSPARDICAYLVGHGAGDAMAGPLCAMLTAQAGTRSLFKDKCASCHDTAADLARTGLVAGDGGTLKGKDNGRDVAEFLAEHGKLDPGEVPIVVETLKRVFKEVQ